ncbi:MAG TPA: hypothetical protein VFI73_03365 [Candidatus Nitrosopolaris sp.]|nr:hypothetical protein [Candidatus Nitrosopolaris sp.]
MFPPAAFMAVIVILASSSFYLNYASATNRFIRDQPSMAILDACTPFPYHIHDSITSPAIVPHVKAKPTWVNVTSTCAQSLDDMKKTCFAAKKYLEESGRSISTSSTFEYCNDPRYENFLVHDFGSPAFIQANSTNSTK